MAVEQVKTGFYEANCKACGWNGKVCGFSAIQIYYSLELDLKVGGIENGLAPFRTRTSVPIARCGPRARRKSVRS